MKFNDLVPNLQAAIGPVILISGVGLLLLSMTNRFGRVLDRSRQLIEVLRAAPAPQRLHTRSELRILHGRARLLRSAITLATISLLTAAVLVISLFLSTLLHLETEILDAALFIGCMLSLIGSLVFFLIDINRSLAALGLELHSIKENLP